MVAFAGRKYAARSVPTFVANSTFIITSFTLVRQCPYLDIIGILFSSHHSLIDVYTFMCPGSGISEG